LPAGLHDQVARFFGTTNQAILGVDDDAIERARLNLSPQAGQLGAIPERVVSTCEGLPEDVLLSDIVATGRTGTTAGIFLGLGTVVVLLIACRHADIDRSAPYGDLG